MSNDPIYKIKRSTLVAIADSIREKNGTTDLIPVLELDNEIDDLTVSGGVPAEVVSSDEMTALLVEENVGKVYKYTGETNEIFTNGCYYLIEDVNE